MVTGNCPFQDWALSTDLSDVRENWLSGEVLQERGPSFDRQMAAIAYTPEGKIRELNVATATHLADDGLSATDIYNLFEIKPQLGLKYVEDLIAEGRGAKDRRLAIAEQMRKAGLSNNVIARRLEISARQVRRLFAEPPS